MTTEQITRAREIIRLCEMRPSEANADGVYAERYEALETAWEYLGEALDEVERLRAELRLFFRLFWQLATHTRAESIRMIGRVREMQRATIQVMGQRDRAESLLEDACHNLGCTVEEFLDGVVRDTMEGTS